MKSLFTLFLLLALSLSEGIAQEATVDCNTPQSQYERDIFVFEEEAKANKELNNIYKYALSLLSAEEQALLKTAQKSWLTFRNNHCKVYGQMYQGSPGMMMMISMCRKELTLHRIEELKLLSER